MPLKPIRMNPHPLPRLALFSLALGLFAPAFAADEKAPPAARKEKDSYPVTTCVVSGDKLGSMGDFISYVHKEAGKPDREVRFCCEGCIEDFKADPKKFLAKLDAAAKEKPEADKKSAPAKKS